MKSSKIIILGSDHAGFALKEVLKKKLMAQKWKIEDLSPTLVPGDDYPPIAKKVATHVVAKKHEGLLFCGSGYGMDIAANRIKGARAIVARTKQDAMLSRKEDHSNILVLGGRVTSSTDAQDILKTWLTTKPIKKPRYLRRVKEIDL